MLHPVSPEVFYDTAPGKQFLETFVAVENDPLHVFTRRRELADGVIRVADLYEPAPAEHTASMMAQLAKYMTANYDPTTNRCTLYRAVSQQQARDFEEHGAITSRLVTYFGNYDVDLAIESLDRAARGNIPGHVSSAIDLGLTEFDEQVAQLDSSFPHMAHHISRLKEHRYETEDLARGNPSDKTIKTLHEKSALLRSAKQLGRQAYLAAVNESNKDHVPSYPGLVDTLTYSSIHLTSDLGYIHRLNNASLHPEEYEWQLRVSFTPGSLAVGPMIGYVDGKYIVPNLMPDDEYEWYGIGQLAVQTDRVDISASRI